MIGLSVIDQGTGKELGLVSDLFFDHYACLQGILLEEHGWFRRKRFVAKADVTIGTDAVIVTERERVVPFSTEYQNWTSFCTGAKSLLGQSLMTDAGGALGQVKNVYFQEEMGTIVGYELSDGWISDLTTGRRLLRTNTPLTWGNGVLVAPSDEVQFHDA